MTRRGKKAVQSKGRAVSPAQQAVNQQTLQLAAQHHSAGNLGQASALYQQILQSDPRHADAMHLLGLVAYQQGVLDQAIALIAKALSLNPKNPDAHYNLAKAYKDFGNLPSAIASYRKALAIRPDVDTHFNLANAHKDLGQWAQAADHYRAAIALNPDYAEALSNLGLVEWELNNVETAVECYRAALEINPKLAEVHYNLSDLMDKARREDDLRTVVAAALENCAGHPLVTLAEAILLKHDKDFISARECLEQLDATKLDEKLEVKRLHLLGMVCDRLNDAPAAFASFTASNRIYRDVATLRGIDATRYVTKLEAHAHRFSTDWTGQWPSYTPTDGRTDPVFLIGFPRSGTTLLDTILRSHPSIAVVEECDAVTKAYEATGLHPERGDQGFSRLMKAKNLTKFRTEYFKELDLHLTPDERMGLVIDKMPLNATTAGVLQCAFPNAKFLLALRHPCDCVLSCFMQNFALNDAMANFLDINDAAKLYDQVMSLWSQYCDVLDLDVHQVRYEDLVVDMESEISPLLDFLGLDWDDGVRDYTETAKKRTRIKTPSYNQVTEKLYTRASGRWLKYREDLKPVLPVLLPWAEKFGYDG